MSCDINFQTPFYAASKFHFFVMNNQNKDLLNFLDKNSCNVNKKLDSDAIVALHLAAISNNNEAAKLLIAKKADINAKTDLDLTPLHYAAENGSLDVMKTLIDNKAELNVQNIDGNTPLHLAGQANNIQAFLNLFFSGADAGIYNNRRKQPLDEIRDKNIRRQVLKEIKRKEVCNRKN